MTKGARACISCEVITEGLLRPEVGAEVFPSDCVGEVVLVDRCLTERHESGIDECFTECVKDLLCVLRRGSGLRV